MRHTLLPFPGALVALSLLGCLADPGAPAIEAAVTACTSDICVENDRTDGVTDPPSSIDLATEATGYAYPASIDRNGPNNHLELRIESTVRDYRIQILRLGDYGGRGARIVATLPGVYPRNDQPPCITESDPDAGPYGDADRCRDVGRTTDRCPSWTGPTWTHPPDLPSGIYLAHVVDAGDGATLATVPFTVRDDRRTSSVLVQVPDTTWAAYNVWGDACNLPGIGAVYVGPPYHPQVDQALGGRIRTTGFERPYADQFAFAQIAPYIQFLEHLGTDVSYITARDLDADWARPTSQSLLVHATGASRVFVVTEHDEYWSQERRNDIERARRAGVHMMFLTANEIHWRTLAGGPDDLFVAKETNRDPLLGRQATWTGLWGDPRYVRSAADDATGPENSTSGLVSGAFSHAGEYHNEILVSRDESRHRFWRGTAYAAGGTANAAPASLEVVADEWDMDADNGFRPLGLVYLSSTATVGNHITMGPTEIGTRSNYTSQITHHMVMFRDPASGAITFHAGTTDFGRALAPAAPCSGGDVHLAALQRGLVNLMADMGLPRPARLPCDTWWSPPPPLPTPPAVLVTVPARPPMMGRSVELRGAASAGDTAAIAAVEVGIRPSGAAQARYQPAAGREQWFLDWTPPAPGSYEIRPRVIDDRGQVADGFPITIVVPATTRLYDDSDAFSAFSTFAVGRWMGTQFRTDVAGTASQLRVIMPDGASYQVALVDMDASPRTAVFGTTEAKSGWRGFAFAAPVALAANRNYAALMWVPANRLYPFVPTAQRSSTADAPPLRSPTGINSSDGDWAQLTAVPFGFPVDVVFDAAAYWSTASATRGWYSALPDSALQTSSTEQRIGFEWKPTADGYVDRLRLVRPAGDTSDYLVELLAGPSDHLSDGPAVMAAAPILAGTSAATFDVPVRVFRGHAYRAVLRVPAGAAFPRTFTLPRGAPWISSIAPVSATCARDAAYDVCNPQMQFYVTSTYAAIDVGFRPTAPFRQSLWPRSGVTPMEPAAAGAPGTMGTIWSSASDGYVEGIRFFAATRETVTVRLYDPTATCAIGTAPELCARLCSATGTPLEDASGWYTLRFERPCPIARNHDYIASVYLPSGRRAHTNEYFQRMDPVTGADPRPSARNLYGDGFLVAHGGVQSAGDVMPTGAPSGDDRAAYFVEPIVRDGR